MKRIAGPLLLLALAGCGQTPGLPLGAEGPMAARRAVTLAELYPAEKGRSWVYQTMSRTGDGPGRPQPDQRFTILDASASATGWGAVMERRFGDRLMPATRIDRSATAVILSRNGAPEAGSLTVLRWPSPQAAWPGRQWAQAAETISMTGTASVTVPAGTFEALTTVHEIRYASGQVDRLRYWYAPGVGMVKAVEGLTIDLGQGPTYQEATALLKETSVR